MPHKTILLIPTVILILSILITQSSSALVGQAADHHHERQLQQTTTLPGQSINAPYTLNPFQAPAGTNINLQPNRNTEASKQIEYQNNNKNFVNNNNRNNIYTTPVYPVPYNTATVAKATRQEASNQVSYSPYGRMESNMVRVSSAEQNMGVGGGSFGGYGASSVNTVTINNNYYGAVILPMNQPLSSVYMPTPIQFPIQFQPPQQQFLPNPINNAILPYPILNPTLPFLTPPSYLQQNLNPTNIQNLPQTTTMPLPTPSSLS